VSSTTKKGPKLAPEVKPVSSHPYLVEKPYDAELAQKPRYFKSYPAALTWIRDDIKKMEPLFRGLGDKAGLEAIGKLVARVGELSIDGGVLEGVIDPLKNLKYRATLVKRQEVTP
jgi:hypothetical protein